MNQMKYLAQAGAMENNRAALHTGIAQNITSQQAANQQRGSVGLGIPAAYGGLALQDKEDQNFAWSPKKVKGLGIVRSTARGRLSDAFHGANLNQLTPDAPAAGGLGSIHLRRFIKQHGATVLLVTFFGAFGFPFLIKEMRAWKKRRPPTDPDFVMDDHFVDLYALARDIEKRGKGKWD